MTWEIEGPLQGRQGAAGGDEENDEMANVRRPILAKTIRSLARLVGRAESSVRNWVDREDWPFSRDPRSHPWDVEKVRAWAEIQLKPDPAAAYRKKARAAEAGTGEFAEMGPLTKARLQAMIERALLLRQRRMIEAGKMHDVEQCNQAKLRQIHEVKSRLLELPRVMAVPLGMQSPETVERLLTAQVLAILDEFAGDPGVDKHGKETSES